jgi:phage-related baseplate assembly protein
MPNPAWNPNTAVATGAVIIDSNGNVQEWLGPAGTTGALPPAVWGSTLSASTQDGAAVVSGSVQPGGWTCVAVLETIALPTGVISLPAPQFVNDADGLNPTAIVNDMVSAYQSATGRTLYPAQVERLYVNLVAYRESLVRNAIQYAALQNLLAYAGYPNLDYLGALLGVSRLPAQGAVATLQFTLGTALPIATTIPAAIQIGTQDAAYIFSTVSALVIPAGSLSGVIAAVCTTPGSGGNGYAAGQVSVQLNPNTLIASVTNTLVTSGGAANETDAHLRARIQAAPNQFSVAGPNNAYRFFTLGVSPSIIDVSVVSPNPGTVNVYILLGPITAQPANAPNNAAIASAALVAEVQAKLSSNDVRPLTDTVNVLAVTEVDYAITGTVTLYADADPTAATTAVNNAATAFAIALGSRIQRDIVPSQIVEALQSVAGVYEVVLTSPSYTPLSAGQWTNCTALALTITQGTEHS